MPSPSDGPAAPPGSEVQYEVDGHVATLTLNRLPRRVGWAKAAEIGFLGRDIDADEAVRLGLTEDFAEGVNSFLEKRPPSFRGR